MTIYRRRVWDALLGSQPLTRWLTALEKWLWSLNEGRR